jgi:hypothetical protein
MQNSKKIFYISILSAAIVYFALANFYKTYRSEVDILIVPQNEKTALMSKQVLANAAKIPLTVSFFNKLVKENIDINNPVDGFSASEKKAYWNSKLNTKVIKNSGIVKFIASDKDFLQAESLAAAAASSGIITLSAYYNIREDAQMRIIDGPITTAGAQYKSFGIIFASLLIGIIIFAVFNWLIPFIQNRISIPDETFYAKSLSENAFAVKKDTKLEPEKEEIKEEVYSITKEIPKSEPIVPKTSEFFSSEKKASAPGNLPIADTSIMNMFGATKNGTGYKISENKPETGENQKKPAVYREATEEEVKERLNKLLGGM